MFENYSSVLISVCHGKHNKRKAVKIDVINETRMATNTQAGSPNKIKSLSFGQYHGIPMTNNKR